MTRRHWMIVYLAFFQVTLTPCCNSKEKAVGIRLLKVKSLFGNMMRACRAHIRRVAHGTPSDDMQQRLSAYCEIYQNCRDIVTDTNQLVNCGMASLRNTSSAVFVKLKDSPKYVADVADLVECSTQMAGPNVTLQDYDDVTAFAKKFFGNLG